MFDRLLDLLFPRVSLEGEEGMHMTDGEFGALVTFPVHTSTEELRAEGLLFLDRITAAGSYGASPLLRTAVHRFKYGRQRSYMRELGTLLVEASEMIEVTEETIICPVPLHWTRRFERGFNQSEVLAEILCGERHWHLAHLLKRRRSTGHQAHRSHEERHAAMRSAFTVTTFNVPEHVVLIDDIATTGSTLDACAEVLKMAGVECVEALVVAKG